MKRLAVFGQIDIVGIRLQILEILNLKSIILQVMESGN